MADWKKVLTEQDIDTTTTLGTSDVKVPSQAAVKTYVDDQVDTKDSIAELDDVSASNPADGHLLVYNTNEFASTAVTGDISIDENAVTAIGNNKVTYAKMQDIVTGNRVLGATTAGDISEVQVQTAMIANNAITNALIADDQIDSEHYVDGSIDTAHIADDAVTSAKLDTNIDIAGTLDVTSNATFDANVTVTGDLTVNGSTTTISTTELEVQDKTIRLGAPDSAYGSDALASTGASGGGIFLESTTADTTETSFARLVWDENGKLSGWKVANTGDSNTQSTAYEIVTMSFSSDSTAPSADLNGVGGFHFDTGNDTLYVRVD